MESGIENILYELELEHAAQKGNLFKVMSLARDRRDWDIVLEQAARCGQLEMVKYAESEGATSQVWGLAAAAVENRVDVFEYLAARLSGKPIIPWVCRIILNAAAKSRNYRMLDFAISNGVKSWETALAEGVIDLIREFQEDIHELQKENDKLKEEVATAKKVETSSPTEEH